MKKNKFKQMLTDIIVFFLFIVLVPIFVGIIWKPEEEITEVRNNTVSAVEESRYRIVYEKETSVDEIPLEDFLIGALAAASSMEYELETLKAQAVLLRSSCYYKMQGNNQVLTYEEMEIICWTVKEMKFAWGDQFQEYYNKCKQAVRETKSVVLLYQGNPIEGTYHTMSGGSTRDGVVLLGEKYGYLKSVSCHKNTEAENFIKEYDFLKKDIGELAILEKDDAGYVLRVSQGEEEMTGEEIRLKLEIPSANFNITRKGEKIILGVRGSGHGMGMDQYYANLLAQKGEDYIEIINYFFDNIDFEKIIE